MMITRRNAFAGGAAALVLGLGSGALALTEDEARVLVGSTVEQVRGLLNQPIGTDVRAPRLRKIMEANTNLPLIARYCAGRSWRDMDDAQRTRYVDAFSHYISVIYARRFADFTNQPEIALGRTIDAGRKGLLIESPMVLGDGKIVAIEWLVSDRGGKVEIIDLVIEGISMAATQREEIGAMIDRRGEDFDALIAHLAEAS